jgi:hypothetical protein
MEKPRWCRIEEHFDAALARSPGEREAYIAEIDDPELAAEVASLLRASDSAAGFLEITEPAAATLAPGERIGPRREAARRATGRCARRGRGWRRPVR